MFCPKCGTKNDDGARFCANCGAPLARPAAQAQGGPAAPAAGMAGQQAAPYAAHQSPYSVPPMAVKPKVNRLPLIGGIAAAAVAIILVVVFVVLPPIQLANSRFNGSFDLSLSGTPIVSISGNGDQMTLGMSYSGFFSSGQNTISGTVDSVSRADDDLAYKLKNVSLSGTDSGETQNMELTLVVPKDASTAKPYGRYAVVMSGVEDGSEILMSIVFTYTSSSVAKLEMVYAQGDASASDDSLQWANVLSASYDPYGNHDNGQGVGYDLTGSANGAGASAFSMNGSDVDVRVIG